MEQIINETRGFSVEGVQKNRSLICTERSGKTAGGHGEKPDIIVSRIGEATLTLNGVDVRPDQDRPEGFQPTIQSVFT